MIKVVIGLIQVEKKILVNQRPKSKPFAGYWELPGGEIEMGENGIQALTRELNEELGIFVEQAELLFVHEHAYPTQPVQLEIWQVMAFSGRPQGLEGQWLKWVTFAELKKLKLLEGNLTILTQLQRAMVKFNG